MRDVILMIMSGQLKERPPKIGSKIAGKKGYFVGGQSSENKFIAQILTHNSKHKSSHTFLKDKIFIEYFLIFKIKFT